MKSNRHLALVGVLTAATLSACGSFDGADDGSGERPETAGTKPALQTAARNGVRDGAPVLGQPYVIDGVTYTPADVVDYDDVGYASWYGSELGGRPTANGEPFAPSAISAAHKTLPLPSYVEVTALDSGRTILVRINDRGPMDNSRLIDLSEGAAKQLGIADRAAAVRVRRVSPPESEREQLRAGLPVPERLETPQSLLNILRTKVAALPVPRGAVAVVVSPTPPAPSAPETRPERAVETPHASGDRFIVEGAGERPAAARPAPPRPAPAVQSEQPARPATTPAPTLGDYIVQVAAFGSKARADGAAKKVGGTVAQAGNVWRVRLGPFENEAAAQAALARAKARGFAEARIMRDR